MAKKRIANYIFLPGVSSTSNAYPNAYSLIQANKTFILKESSAFIASRVVSDSAKNIFPNAVSLLTNNKQFILDEVSSWTSLQVSTATVGSTFYGYTYGATEKSKCKRDMGYLIDALIADIKWGGNESVKNIASQYYQSGVIQLINVPVELSIQTQLWNIITNYILPKSPYASTQSPVTSTQSLSGSAAESSALTQAVSLSTIAYNVINGGLSTMPATIYSAYPFAGYVYDSGKCERDVGYVIDAYLNDLRYGGNAQTRSIASRYWYGERPQIVGDRQTEVVTHQFIRDLINDVIFQGDYIAKCQRDVGYLIDGVQYDVALGTNYNQVFLGIAELNSLSISPFVISTFFDTKAAVAAIPAVASDSTSLGRANNFFQEVIDIASNGRENANTLVFTNPPTATQSQIAVNDKLVNNKAFIAAEVNAWVANNYPASTHDPLKCSRDIGYAIDALCYDVLYGGNSATWRQAKFFFYGFANGTPGINPTHTAVTVAAYNYFKSIVDDVVKGIAIPKTTTGSNPNTLTQVTAGNNASNGDATICQNLVQITTSVINAGSQTAALAYLATVPEVFPSITWATSGAQAASTAIAAAKASIISSVVYNYYQTSYPRILLGGILGEEDAILRITALSEVITSVIQNGLGSMPDLVNGVTTIKFQGHYTLDKILLITNSANNQILYNFSDPTLGASLSFFSTHDSNGYNYDLDFPQFYQTCDYVTTLQLSADTSSASLSDPIQIFVEGEEQKIRPYDFGTDAIERMRVAQPQSMLDADFEYGLQPTKWQAIGIARGYPSVYEIPGSDTAVLTVVTDASAGTGGVGDSLITVTTANAHGFVVGTPFTIRSLANTISGFNRAEGTFTVISVPSPTTFTYYAVAKVGTSNGQILATTYTQLRKAGFYTGASIGQPTLSVYTNGQVGSFTSKLITPVGSQQIAVGGALPSLGVPISVVGANAGTQISGTVGPGGLAVTANIDTQANIGDSSISVVSTSGILEGMAIDRGDGQAIFVSQIQGNSVNFNGQLTSSKAGTTQTYLNTIGTNITPTGTGAQFNLDRVSGAYANLTVSNGGSSYVLNSRLLIIGSLLEGVDNVNDVIIKVTGLNNGLLEAVTPAGTATAGSGTVATGISQDATTGSGLGATFNISKDSGSYSVTVVTSGTNYAVNDTVTILGTNLGGVDITNDLVMTVTSVVNGNIATADIISGTSVDGERSYVGLTQSSTTGSGAGALFNVQTSAGAYVVQMTDSGATYALGNDLVILGSALGGIDGINDLTITVTSVSAFGGGILTYNAAGTPASTNHTFTALDVIKITPGNGASFDVTRSSGSYTTVAVNLAGANYAVNDVIVVDGSTIGGLVTTNDATITVTGVDMFTGEITTATISGTAVTGTSVQFWSAVSLSEVTTGAIADGTSISTIAIATIQATFLTNHGLVPGMSILVDITSTGTNHTYAKGVFYVEQVPSATTIRYTARTSGVIDTGTALSGSVYSRPQSFFIHRPYDGGVQLGTGGPQHGSQSVRMSKKYIRYQSGKGVMYTTGALFAPSYNLQSATASGTAIGSYIQFTTDDTDHGLQAGGKVIISGIDTAGYNNEYTVVSIQTERIFTVQAQSTLGSLTGSITSNAQMSILNWHGAVVRAGTFDDQNGMFWAYDGQQLYVGRRSSTFQLAGVASIAKDTNVVTGTNSRFRDQLKAGDKIVIKGMTHTVTSVASQTQLYVTPDYRGANNCVNGKICLVQEIVIPQSQFNLDKLDGTGPSGYNLDITKMQMIGMQWSWYGAGFIDFMLRGSDGNYVFCHRIRNSNVNTEAYMRTGNMPVRYEVQNEVPSGKLYSSITASQTTLPLYDASGFPNESGYVYVDNEIIAFTGKTGNTLTGCTRAASLPQFSGGATRLFKAGAATTHEVNTGVILISNTITPIISHWGSAFLTDGLFNEDRGYIFNYVSTGIQASTTKQTAFLIRLAPSVSNAQVGDLGDKELINRAQLLLQGIEVTSDTGTGGLVVEGILNPQNYPVDPSAITWSALNTSAAGGQPSFAQVAPGGSVSWSGGATTTTATATTSTALTGSASVPNNALFTSSSGSNVVYLTKASWDALGASAGFAVDSTETRFPNGTTISSVTANPNPIATTIDLITGSATVPPSTFFARPANVNSLYFTQASWTALNGAIGTAVYSSDFPAGTTVTNVAGPAVAAGQSYYTVTFSNNTTAIHNPIQSNIPITVYNITSNVVTLYFNATQAYAPYVVGETITVNTGVTAINGSRAVTACTTTYVQFTFVTANVGNTATTGNVINGTPLNTVSFYVTGQANSGASSLNFTQASWSALPIGTAVVGQTVNDTGKFNAGTQISAISTLKTFNGVNYYTVTFNSTLLSAIPVSTAVTFNYIPYYTVVLSKNSTSSVAYNTTIPFTPAIIGTNTSFLYFTQASWESLVSSYAAGVGTVVADTAKFPSGTTVQSVSTLSSFGGTPYYRVNFTQSSITSVAGGSTVTFQFGQPPYALPGETVFSFIASPGTQSALDLSNLKELTNTAIGGRGTYPNGPDVLAINVYKTSGSALPTNVIIRWGEAQA